MRLENFELYDSNAKLLVRDYDILILRDKTDKTLYKFYKKSEEDFYTYDGYEQSKNYQDQRQYDIIFHVTGMDYTPPNSKIFDKNNKYIIDIKAGKLANQIDIMEVVDD